ncbi:hypothetical protein JOM56_004468 [Amanita muscaria]
MAMDEFPKLLVKEMSKSLVWSAENVDGFLKSGDGLKMEGYAHCLIYSAIIQEHFGHSLKEIDRGLVLDFQSQHSPRTAGIGHYAVERLQQTTGIRYTAHEKQMIVAQAMHAFCYLVKPIAAAASQATVPLRSMTSGIQSHEHYAFFSARQLILQKYQLASLPAVHVAVKSRHLCWAAPFLYRENVPESESLGDDILIQLVLELHRGPGVSQGTPSDDSVIHFTASGATLASTWTDVGSVAASQTSTGTEKEGRGAITLTPDVNFSPLEAASAGATTLVPGRPEQLHIDTESGFV